MDSLIYFCYKLRADTVSGLISHFETSEIHQLTGSGRTNKYCANWAGQSPKIMMSALISSTVKNANEWKQGCKYSKAQTNKHKHRALYTAGDHCSREGDMMCFNLMYPTHLTNWLQLSTNKKVVISATDQ